MGLSLAMVVNSTLTAVKKWITTDSNLAGERDSVSIALLLRKAAVGRPGSQEKTGYVHTARWKLSCTS